MFGILKKLPALIKQFFTREVCYSDKEAKGSAAMNVCAGDFLDRCENCPYFYKNRR